ncbi:MAG: glycosyltransferase family 39 protein [Thermoanaerobaculia bacterium]
MSTRSGRRESLLILLMTLAVAAFRVWGRAASLWDWDEVQFSRSLEDFDVGSHSPHPPGFPIFVALAHLVRPLVSSDFRAFQSISVAASILLVPLTWWLLREAGASRIERVLAPLLLAAMPTVAVFGGMALSDSLAVAIVLAACAAFLRSQERREWFFVAAILAALACGVRAQSALMILGVALIAAHRRIRERAWPQLIAATIASALLVTAIYGLAARASGGFEPYLEVSAKHAKYIRDVDSWQSTTAPPVPQRIDDFLFAWGAESMGEILVWLALAGLVAGSIRREKTVGIVLLIFLPFLVFALFTLDVNSARRFALAYAPAVAFFAARGSVGLTRWTGRWRVPLAVTLCLLLATLMQVRSVSAIRDVREEPSPTAAAFAFLQEKVRRDPSVHIYADFALSPFAQYLLPEGNYTVVDDRPPASVAAGSWFVMEGVAFEPGVRTFRRSERPLGEIVRRRYFQVSVVPLARGVGLGPQWYGLESDEWKSWRWMPRSATLSLPAREQPFVLDLRLRIPEYLRGTPPEVRLKLDEQPFGAARLTESSLVLRAEFPPGPAATLTIESSRSFVPSEVSDSTDDRELALCIEEISWHPASQQGGP